MAALMGSVEIRTAEYRPCYVHDKKALFHRWVEKTNVFFKLKNCNTRAFEKVKLAIETFKRYNVIDDYLDVEKVRELFAVVEYEDGTVAEVEPTAVRFVPGIMNEYNFGTEEVENDETCNATD